MDQNSNQTPADQQPMPKRKWFHWSKGLIISLILPLVLLAASTGYIWLGEGSTRFEPQRPLYVITPTATQIPTATPSSTLIPTNVINRHSGKS